MKYMKKFNVSFQKFNEATSRSIDLFSSKEIDIKVKLSDLIFNTHLIILMEDGKVFEKTKGNNSWVNYTSKSEFERKTGASLDREYSGNESKKLLNLFKDLVGIDKVYINDEIDPLLNSTIENIN